MNDTPNNTCIHAYLHTCLLAFTYMHASIHAYLRIHAYFPTPLAPPTYHWLHPSYYVTTISLNYTFLGGFSALNCHAVLRNHYTYFRHGMGYTHTIKRCNLFSSFACPFFCIKQFFLGRSIASDVMRSCSHVLLVM